MFNSTELDLRVPKVTILLGSWGLLIFLGGVINQWFNLSADFTLLLWVGITVLGIAAQLVTMVKGLGFNLGIWAGLMVAGWLFTYYVVKFDNGAHIDLFGDLSGVWLVLLGIGYIATAFQVDKRFLIVAGVHLLVGALLELSSRQVVSITFLDTYSPLIFGLVGGIPLIVAALPVWLEKPEAKAPETPPAKANIHGQNQDQLQPLRPAQNYPNPNYQNQGYPQQTYQGQNPNYQNQSYPNPNYPPNQPNQNYSDRR
ncbi:MAG: hypothetical protein J0I20_08110 [Chloroflexi bacterium]|nr:hypothetical protein [Chloroflexota bacterium]OJV97156.1 MAG: hypothetical protein BGO39_19425 [Chloroflexi bacterium 54-19]